MLLLVFVIVAIFAPLLAPYKPDATDLDNALAPPSPEHWLGTDQVGRDTFSRLLYGARTRLVGPLAVVVSRPSSASWSGCWPAGGAAGWTRCCRACWTSCSRSRLCCWRSSPCRSSARAWSRRWSRCDRLHAVRRPAGPQPGAAGKARPYVAAYRVQGFGPVDVAVRRLLPNISPTVLAQSTVNFGYALLDLAALSFLGLGVQPPTPDWGAMINEGRGAVLSGQPLSAVAPALAVIVTVVAFNVVGEALGDRIARRDG